jgi:hypothetical protein
VTSEDTIHVAADERPLVFARATVRVFADHRDDTGARLMGHGFVGDAGRADQRAPDDVKFIAKLSPVLVPKGRAMIISKSLGRRVGLTHAATV